MKLLGQPVRVLTPDLRLRMTRVRAVTARASQFCPSCESRILPVKPRLRDEPLCNQTRHVYEVTDPWIMSVTRSVGQCLIFTQLCMLSQVRSGQRSKGERDTRTTRQLDMNGGTEVWDPTGERAAASPEERE